MAEKISKSAAPKKVASPTKATVKAKAAPVKAPPAKAAPAKTSAKSVEKAPTKSVTVAKTATKVSVSKLPEKRRISDELRYRMIAEAAYFRAERCHFKSDSVRDWIEAERDIALLLGEK